MRDAGGGAAQQALGHKRIQTTLIYAKIVEDSQHHTPCSGSGTALLPGGAPMLVGAVHAVEPVAARVWPIATVMPPTDWYCTRRTGHSDLADFLLLKKSCQWDLPATAPAGSICLPVQTICKVEPKRK